MKSVFKFIFNRFVPRRWHLPAKFYLSRFRHGLDQELIYACNNISTDGLAIDVGSNVGFYSYQLQKYFRKVESFEPIASCSEMLLEFAKGLPKLTVHNVALSDQVASTKINVPVLKNGSLNYGYSSISNDFEQQQSFSVSLKKLDDYDFQGVSFIKIDVEGHEIEVLRGAADTIRRCNPVLLIEIEKRHGSEDKFKEVFDFLLELKYQAFFIHSGALRGMEEFDVNVHQAPESIGSSQYINNFFFMPVTS